MEWTFSADLPIYSQLVAQIKLAIVSGVYLPGERLAPVRELAMEAGVNPNTMQRALQELEREGMVYTQRTSGRFVTEDTKVIESAKKLLAEREIKSFRAQMTRLGYPKEEIVSLLEASIEEEKNNGDMGMYEPLQALRQCAGAGQCELRGGAGAGCGPVGAKRQRQDHTNQAGQRSADAYGRGAADQRAEAGKGYPGSGVLSAGQALPAGMDERGKAAEHVFGLLRGFSAGQGPGDAGKAGH